MANEIRLRSNNIGGAITDNPLTNVATTINSPGFVDLPTVDTTNHLIVILDPLESNGPAECVRVVSHAAASSQITVFRGAEGSAARTHVLGTTWFHGPVASDYNYTQRAALSSNRPPSPFAGEMVYESDTGRWSSFTGGAWQPAPHNVPTCRVFASANQLMGHGGPTTVLFNSELFDTDTMHSTAVNTSRITFNTPGVYYVGFHGSMTPAGDYVEIRATLEINGAAVVGMGSEVGAMNSSGTNVGIAASTIYKFVATDYIECRIWQVNGASAGRNLLGSTSTAFFATWVAVG